MMCVLMFSDDLSSAHKLNPVKKCGRWTSVECEQINSLFHEPHNGANNTRNHGNCKQQRWRQLQPDDA